MSGLWSEIFFVGIGSSGAEGPCICWRPLNAVLTDCDAEWDASISLLWICSFKSSAVHPQYSTILSSSSQVTASAGGWVVLLSPCSTLADLVHCITDSLLHHLRKLT